VVSGTRKATLYKWYDLPREELHERLSRRLITGDRVMLAHVYLKQGCVVPRHSHENEQFTYILEGALRFLVGADGAEEIVVRAGEVLHLPAHLPHEAHALEDTLDVDVFSPPREDGRVSQEVVCPIARRNSRSHAAAMPSRGEYGPGS